jgi:hypothetical protein
MVSLARTLDRIATQRGTPTGDYFFDKMKANPRQRPSSNPNEPDPSIVGPWSSDTIAEARLRWFWSQSGGDLGEKSAQEALVFRIASGGASSAASFETIAGEVTARTPGDWQLAAANRFRQIRAEIAQLTGEHQAVLEMSFGLRRGDPEVLVLLRGEDEKLEPVVTFMRRTRRIVLGSEDGKPVVLVDWKKVELSSVVEQARDLRGAALRAYEVAAGLARPTGAAGGPKRRSRPPGASIGVRVSAGARGASSRRFRPVEPQQ